MQYYLAPMEGITGYLFRNIHREMFSGVDRYYMPFIAPHTDGSLKSREKSDTDPANNPAADVIPQILSSHADSTILAARRLCQQGYREVNLNLGCPYPTVVSKGKGAGFLEYPDLLARWLDEIFSAADMPRISVKTRLCSGSQEQMDSLFELYGRFPVSELTIHPRRQKDFYKGTPDRNAFAHIVSGIRLPVCYNGNLYTPADVSAFANDFPGIQAVMIGRGLVRNPALARMCRGGAPLTLSELQAFHQRLYDAYGRHLSGPSAVLGHMKELWLYWETGLTVSSKAVKALYKSRTFAQYEAAVSVLFAEAQLLPPDEKPRVTAKLAL